MADQADVLRRVCARLLALKQNLPLNVLMEYLQQFHEAIDQLGEAGFDVTAFRVPQAAVRQLSERGAPYVDREFLLTRIDEVLAYFGIPGDKIGFTGPRQSE